ncbi:hypothetical protein TRFO_25085 [Tritrichomonas foetus]|uniref:Uncharacterized protein n=1 Tax=Tritrichomonas foetus TaxID=1144522 RepID=A0A1J4KBI4_9EUKA|nr:hypothetical protein TRFO_25085 [Tritrichomonas foetus]|eukprot:OHT06837.1 hypothetical protein TRFO_25085 [Tritrichomonas foetus]
MIQKKWKIFIIESIETEYIFNFVIQIERRPLIQSSLLLNPPRQSPRKSLVKHEELTYVKSTVNVQTLTKADIARIDNLIISLLEIKKHKQESMTKDKIKCTIKISPIKKIRYVDHIIDKYLAHRILVNEYNRKLVNYNINAIGAIERVVTLIKTIVSESRNVKLDLAEFQNFLDRKYVSAGITKAKEETEKITKILQIMANKLHTLDSDEIYLNKVIKKQIVKVEKNNDYLPPNFFDECVHAFLNTKKTDDKNLSAVLSNLKYGNENYISQLIVYITKIIQGKQTYSNQENIVIRSAVIRFFFDMAYISQPEVLCSNLSSMIFFKNCTYIASFSPNKLGLNPQLFTQNQINSPIAAIVRDSPLMAEISHDLNSLMFYTSPIDMTKILTDVIVKLDEIVKKNVLSRKFGQFAAMVESDFKQKKRNEMMSFDDCFSLFFSILSVDPPTNALEISVLFQNSPDFVESVQMKYAKATYVSAVQHILEFTDEQLVEDVVDEFPSSDPLGIL